jgi:hypothetical protein
MANMLPFSFPSPITQTPSQLSYSDLNFIEMTSISKAHPWLEAINSLLEKRKLLFRKLFSNGVFLFTVHLAQNKYKLYLHLEKTPMSFFSQIQ